ncbi:MAG: SIR2 family protein [Chloroflexi bacterium]|nr:SIR2 family protein [Chloroflexota bacterium]
MDIPRELVDQLARGNGVLFVGAELSQGARLPGWNDLLTPLADSIGLPAHLRADPLKIAQYYETARGRQALVSHVVEQTDTTGKGPTDNHRRLARLGIRTWMTTNYDDLLEQTLREARERYIVVVRDENLPYVSADAVTLLKLHGDRQQPGTIVITEQDYRTYFRSFPQVKVKLTGLLLEKTFLFVGYSVNDPDFNQIHAEIAYDLQQHQRVAYAVLLDADEFTLSDLRARNIHVLNIPLGGQANRSERLGELLDDLIRQVDQARQQRAQPERPAVVTPAPPEAEDMRGLLEAMGYRITDTETVGADLYFLCDAKWGAEIRQEVVHFVSGQPTARDVVALNDAVVSYGVARGILLSHRSLPAALCDWARQHKCIQCYTLDEFIDRLSDFRLYLERLILEHEASEIPQFYVPLAVGSGGEGKASQELESFTDAWLSEPGRNHLSILGDFGSGKTWFCQRYAYLVAKRYLADPARNRIPILITLRDYSRAYDVKQLITDALVNRYKVGLAAGYETFVWLNSAGRLLLIFDGFDEMERRVSDYRTTADNFWELAKAVGPASKVLLTCRTEYFRHRGEEERTLTRQRSQVSVPAGDQVIDLRGRQGFEVVYLRDFGDEDIQLALQKRLPVGWGPVYQKILDLSNLHDLASRPMLLGMIAKTLSKIQDAGQINQTTLYKTYTDELLKWRPSENTDYIQPQDRLFFVQELAWEMYTSQRLTIPFSEFPERVTKHFGLKGDQKQADFFERDVRTQSYLVRDDPGNYRFVHKSFMEYFVACKMADTISGLDFDVEKAVEVWKMQPLTPEVRDFLLPMMTDPALLWRLIEATRGKTIIDVNYAGGNAATLLRWKGEPLTRARLAETVLVNADLSGMDLTQADLRGACLRQANLIGCIFEGADLRGADLTDIKIDERGTVLSAAWSSDGRYLFTGSQDGNLRVWDMSSSESPNVCQTATALGDYGQVMKMTMCYVPDRNKVVCSMRVPSKDPDDHDFFSSFVVFDFVSSARKPKLVKQYSFSTEYTLDKLGLHRREWASYLESIETPDLLVVLPQRDILIGLSDRGVTYLCLSDSTGHFYMIPATGGAGSTIESPFSFYLETAIGGANVFVAFRDPQSQELFGLVKKRRVGSFFDAEPGTMRLLVRDFLAVDCGDNLWFLKNSRPIATGHKLAHVRIVYSDASRVLFAFDVPDQVIEIWDWQACKMQTRLSGHKDGITWFTLDSEGTRLASCSCDGTVRIWNVKLGSPVFGECLRVLEVARNYRRTHISNAKGLDAPAPDGKSALRDWLIARGAVE